MLKYLLILCLIQLIRSQTTQDPMKIFKNGMSQQMERHAMSAVFKEIETPKDNKLRARNIANEMNGKFGRGWVCSVGSNDTGTNLDIDENTYIWFKFEDIEVVVFRVLQTTNWDLISDARNSINDTKIVNSTLVDKQIEAKIEVIIKTSILNLKDFKSISINITKEIKAQNGGDWIVLIGDKNSEVSVDQLTETIIINIVDIRIVVYKEKSGNCQNKTKDIIKEAKTTINSQSPITLEHIPNMTNGNVRVNNIELYYICEKGNVVGFINAINRTLNDNSLADCVDCLKLIENTLSDILIAEFSSSYYWMVEVHTIIETSQNPIIFNMQGTNRPILIWTQIKDMFFTVLSITK